MVFKLFKRSENTIEEPAILLCSLSMHDSSCISKDKLIYQNHRNITEYRAASFSDFLTFLNHKTFDIVHLLTKVEPDGTIEGTSGFELFESLSNGKVKLVIFASDNPADSYLKLIPKDRSKSIKPMNIVMTLDRKGDSFQRFFQSLFDLMAQGDSMPVAWVTLVPQSPGVVNKNVPDTIFQAGLGPIGFK